MQIIKKVAMQPWMLPVRAKWYFRHVCALAGCMNIIVLMAVNLVSALPLPCTDVLNTDTCRHEQQPVHEGLACFGMLQVSACMNCTICTTVIFCMSKCHCISCCILGRQGCSDCNHF